MLLLLQIQINSQINKIEQLIVLILENDFSATFYDILSAALINLTLLVSVATAERSFS